MSRHVVVDSKGTWVFGWDPPLKSFFLQLHDYTRPEDEQIILWLGADRTSMMHNVRDLVHTAHDHGFLIDQGKRQILQDDLMENR